MWIKIENFFVKLFSSRKEVKINKEKTKDVEVENSPNSIQNTGDGNINNSIFKNSNVGKNITNNFFNRGISREETEEIIKNFSKEIKKEVSKSEESINKKLSDLSEKAKISKKELLTDSYKLEEIKKEVKKLYPEIKTKDDKIGYELIFQGCLMLKLRESVVNILDYLFEIDFKYMKEEELDGIKRTLVMIFNLFDFKTWKDKNRKIIKYCLIHIVRDCKECFRDEEKKEFDLKEDEQKQFPLCENNELNFWIIDDKPGVKEELIKEDIWNMRLEAWGDKEGKTKLHFWLVEKEDFKNKKLSQNKILSSNIISERNNMLVLKVKKNDEWFREEIRKLQAINITETVLTYKEAAKNYEGCEAWLLESYKLKNLSKENDIKFSREE